MSLSAQSTVAAPEDATPAPEGPPPDLVALFPHVPLERWERTPARPGTTGGWRVSTGEKDRVPITDTLRKVQNPERMTLAQAIKVSLERARKARQGEGVVHAGRPNPALARRYEQQARELRVMSAIARRPGGPGATSPRRKPIPRPAAHRPAARRSLGARSSPDPGDGGEASSQSGSRRDPLGESSPAGRRYSLATYRRILWELSEREAAKETATAVSRAAKVRCERLITAMERAEAEGGRLTLEEALDAREGGEHVDAQWWGGTAQLVDLLWWSQVPFTEIAEGVITQCPECVRGPLFAVERRADHAELTCAHGCAEASVRKKLKEVEALAFDHVHEREGVSR